MKSRKGCHVFLDNKDYGLTEVVYPPATFGGCVFIKIFIDISEGGRMRIVGFKTDANQSTIFGVARATDESLINTLLCLFA
ncbi:hypothetical protein D3C71_1894750 [compost metagenome]